jgi:hypothetical protein
VAVLAGLAAPLALAALSRRSGPVSPTPAGRLPGRDQRRRAGRRHRESPPELIGQARIGDLASVPGRAWRAEADAYLVGAGEQVGRVGVDAVGARPLQFLPAVAT